MQRFLSLLLVLLTISVNGNVTLALGTEELGNNPVADNYADWPGIVPLMNSEGRVYNRWVNGDDHFYFQGETARLNAALKQFATIESSERRVIIRPDRGDTYSFHGMHILYNWELNLMGGIARNRLARDKGELVWNKFPTLTLYLGGGIDLKQLEIPDGITLVSPADLKRRYFEAINASTDKDVRVRGITNLVHLDIYDGESVKAIANRIKDEVPFVRRHAAGTLRNFGPRAKLAFEELRSAANSDENCLKEVAKKTIAKVESAVENPDDEPRFHATLAEIERFVESHRKKSN